MNYPSFILGLVWTVVCAVVNAAAPPPADVPPPVPLSGSPIDFFRELLQMDEDSRLRALERRTPRQQQVILAKLSEYEAMPEYEREIRLEVTELHYYLTPLLAKSAEERQAALNVVPEPKKALIMNRLRQWDTLSPETQKQLIANKQVRDWFLRQEIERKMPPPLPTSPLALPFSPVRQQLSREHSQRMEEVFERFVKLPVKERMKTLEGVPAQQKNRILLAANQLAQMPSNLRRQCIGSYLKIVAMSESEQRRIVGKVTHWHSLGPEEKDVLRAVVPQIPPLPPGLSVSNLPPLPPR